MDKDGFPLIEVTGNCALVDDWYVVFDTGHIYSFYYQRFLTPWRDSSSGRFRVELYNGEGSRCRYYLHRLVAKAFIPKDFERPVIDHRDSDPANNQVDNLRWCTQSENLSFSDKLSEAALLREARKRRFVV